MYQKEIDIDVEIIELARNFAGFLIENYSGREGQAGWNIRQPQRTDMLSWNNPENIDTGVSGIILFLLELYRQTGEIKYLEFADTAINDLVRYCETNSTRNYSLYAGRAGVAYLLLQRHLISAEPRLIDKAIQLIKPANQHFLHSNYTTDYLYDGRAGTLLVILYLYLISGDTFLMDHIRQFVDKILANAQYAGNGVCWHSEEELNLKPSCGFAYGAAGITYVLQQLHRYCNSDALDYIIKKTRTYIDHCWDTDIKNWGDYRRPHLSFDSLKKYRESHAKREDGLFTRASNYSWAYGAAGVLCSSPRHAAEIISPSQLPGYINKGQYPGDCLYDGLAGIGLCLLHHPVVMGQHPANDPQSRFTDKYANRPPGPDGGLMHGQAGVLYFLLQSNSSGKTRENILAPFLPNGSHDHATINLPVSVSQVRSTLIAKCFPRTINLLKILSPAGYEEYMQNTGIAIEADEISLFVQFFRNVVLPKVNASVKERLEDLFHLETQKLDYFQALRKSSFHFFMEKLSQQEACLQLLNNTDDWVCDQVAVISKKIRIIRTRWNWSLDVESEAVQQDTMIKKHGRNFTEPPGLHESVIQPAAKFEDCEVYFEDAYRALLHCFDGPKQIRQALVEIKHFIQSLPREKYVEMLTAIGALEDSRGTNFFHVGSSLVLTKIKTWIHRDILAFDKQFSRV